MKDFITAAGAGLLILAAELAAHSPKRRDFVVDYARYVVLQAKRRPQVRMSKADEEEYRVFLQNIRPAEWASRLFKIGIALLLAAQLFSSLSHEVPLHRAVPTDDPAL